MSGFLRLRYKINYDAVLMDAYSVLCGYSPILITVAIASYGFVLLYEKMFC